jgi:hypothetical protein
MQDEKTEQEKILEEFVQREEAPIPISQVGPKITPIGNTHMPWEREERALGNQLGWIPLPIGDMPTQGLFYPKGTLIAIRSANGGEIRHWSTLSENEEDPNYLSHLDDMLNYVIERCVTIKAANPDTGALLSWKDIKEVDRFYLLLAIHELTFPDGENKLQVKVSDTKKLDVRKDMVSYITLDPKLMQHYDEDDRCFVMGIRGTDRQIKIDIPSIGVTQWLKTYIQRKQRARQEFDEDYLSYAPFLIRSFRGLNDDVYNHFVEESHKWGNVEISVMVKIKKLFADTIDPVVKFTDEGGAERTTPLNFQGGIKSLFIISDPFGELV